MKQLSIYDHDYLNDTASHFNVDTFDADTSIVDTSNIDTSNVDTSNVDSFKQDDHTITPKSNTTAHSASTLVGACSGLSQTDQDQNALEKFPANVTEIVLTNNTDSIQLILPMLINLHQEKRWLAWIDPPIQLLKEWQKTHNDSALNDIMILRSNPQLSVFELGKRALTAGTCHAVIAWTNSLNNEEFTKLEIASSLGNSHGIILKSRS